MQSRILTLSICNFVLNRKIFYFPFLYASLYKQLLNFVFLFVLVEEVQFSCCQCVVSTSTCEMLQEHIKIHHPVYTCAFCGFAAADSSSLLEHKRRNHSTQCSLCSYTATYLGSLYKHMSARHNMIHCELCFIPLATAQDLAQHTREAHAYSFNCDKCPFVAKISSALKTHQKVRKFQNLFFFFSPYLFEFEVKCYFFQYERLTKLKL